jgi:hypothetical protein
MGFQEFQSQQMVNEASLNTQGFGSRSLVKDILAGMDQNADFPLRMHANFPTPDAKLYFSANKIQAFDGAEKSISPIGVSIPTVPASTLDFQTGATTGGTFNITFPATTIGNYRRVGFTYKYDGSINGIFSAESATLIGLANPGTLFVSGGIPMGWIDLQATGSTAFRTAGSLSSIIENAPGGVAAIHRIPFAAPFVPLVYLKYKTSETARVYTDNANTTALITTQVWDTTGGAWSGTHFTVPGDGFYRLIHSVQMSSANWTSPNLFRGILESNMFGILSQKTYMNLNGNNILASAQFIYEEFLTKGDLIEFDIGHQAGVNLNLSGDSTENWMVIKQVA